MLIARNMRQGLQIVHQRGRELDLAVMDFDGDCRARVLLSAVHTCYEELPILVTSSDSDQTSFLAYASGARNYLKKPLEPLNLAKAIAETSGCLALSMPHQV